MLDRYDAQRLYLHALVIEWGLGDVGTHGLEPTIQVHVPNIIIIIIMQITWCVCSKSKHCACDSFQLATGSFCRIAVPKIRYTPVPVIIQLSCILISYSSWDKL